MHLIAEQNICDAKANKTRKKKINEFFIIVGDLNIPLSIRNAADAAGRKSVSTWLNLTAPLINWI